MKLSWFGRLALALFASLALGLGMSACGGGTIAYLWVLGQQYNQIAAFKVDDYTGNLTQTPHEPFSVQGTNPVTLVVKAGGRFVYVLNQGTLPSTCTSASTCTTAWTGSGIVEFSVGGDGSLTYQQTYHSQGFEPVWMQFDSTNSYLYVVDKYSPSGDGNGSITSFSIDPTTGRLTLVLNTQSVPPNSPAPTYWEVGKNPIMMKQLGSCLFTVNSADQSITPYSTSGGQLVNTTTGKIATSASNITSINGNGSTIILTDAGSNEILPYAVGSSCNLNSTDGGATPNAAGTSNPVNSFIATGGTNTYLYILNQSTTNTTSNQPYSSISGFLVQSTGLAPLTAGSANGVYQVQAAPVCMVEDPTNKWMYVSNRDPGAVTGKQFDQTTGALSDLPRGSNFPATGLASCLAISGNVD
ncbi:MAG TPA: beta-propeller fold lactonase family protein [Acidobacteriaceae bacterium]|nr:beta-propeller fold lactonase family protein [Acidobacteriaceae bacterium]